jgi:hypothetical protein
MKTEIRTLAAICILGFIGTINVNAANYKNANNNVVVEEVKNTMNGLGNEDGGLLLLAEKASLESNAKVEFLLNEDLDAKVDLQKEAQAVTKWIVDQEEAKVIQKLLTQGKSNEFESVQILPNEDSAENVDFQKEAQSVTKWIVDNEEAKLTQKLIDEGKLEGIN